MGEVRHSLPSLKPKFANKYKIVKARNLIARSKVRLYFRTLLRTCASDSAAAKLLKALEPIFLIAYGVNIQTLADSLKRNILGEIVA